MCNRNNNDCEKLIRNCGMEERFKNVLNEMREIPNFWDDYEIRYDTLTTNFKTDILNNSNYVINKKNRNFSPENKINHNIQFNNKIYQNDDIKNNNLSNDNISNSNLSYINRRNKNQLFDKSSENFSIEYKIDENNIVRFK